MNIKEASTALSSLLDHDIPAFLWGKPGVGKSQLIKQIAKLRGWGLIDFRASTRDPVALMGIPDVTGETSRWKVPDEFPQVERDGAEGIFLLDELNAAAPSMQAACFGLVLDRKVGDYTMPPGWRIVAAGNRQTDGAAAQRMPTALANRFAHIDVDPDVNSLVEYFNAIEVDPIIVAYLRWRPEQVHAMGSRDARAFPTPRSWEQVAKIIDVPSTLRLQLATSMIGEGAAGELESFIRLYRSLPSIESVFANPTGTKVPDEPSALYAMATALARRVDAATIDAAMTYTQRMPRDFDIIFAIDATRRDPKLSHTSAFTAWALRNRDVVLG